jgi:hypothetical protein
MENYTVIFWLKSGTVDLRPYDSKIEWSGPAADIIGYSQHIQNAAGSSTNPKGVCKFKLRGGLWMIWEGFAGSAHSQIFGFINGLAWAHKDGAFASYGDDRWVGQSSGKGDRDV